MHSLYISDLLRKNNLTPERVKLIRHSLSHERFRIAYETNFILEYTQMQRPNFFNGFDYALVFVGDEGTTAKLVGCYKITGVMKKLAATVFPSEYPSVLLEQPGHGKNIFHKLKNTKLFQDLINRLYIEWGKGTVNWHQKATNEKPIIKIGHVPKFQFSGYENLILKFEELEEILKDSVQYSEWHAALKSVNAIYLVTVLETGQQYVGSASGEDSILQRWKNYLRTKHGGNQRLKQLLNADPDLYKKFQFSILQVIPKNMTRSDVNELEDLYKRKLLTRTWENQNGLNDN